jgi:hypothetical protein
MKKTLRKSQPIKRKKKDFEKCFYEYYFRDASDQSNIPIEKFCPPKANKKKSNKHLRTINLAYIQNVTQSQKFVTDFVKYLDQDFIGDYSKVIDEKLTALVMKWENQFIGSSMSPDVIQAICEKIERCPKCKLPWNIKEIEFAIAFVKRLLFNSNVY